MQDLKRLEKSTVQTMSTKSIEKRSGGERRKETSCGFVCISIVGWICRREQNRRKEDSDLFTGGMAG